MDCFGDEYSSLYDVVYQDKDYRAECSFIETLLRKWERQPTQRVLDFGCGTGNHALELAVRGFELTGIDRSMNMLVAAQRKAKALNLNGSEPQWRTELPTEGQWHAAISMFAVLNYLDGKAAAIELLQKFRELLVPGGLVVIDTWNGVAVPFLSEPSRERSFVSKGREITRRTAAKLDWRRQVLDIEFTFFEGKEAEPRVAELHRMHYYTPQEMAEMAERAGFAVREICPAYEMRPLEMKDFSAIYVLQR